MKSTNIFAALILMSFATACAQKQRIEVDCIWAREFHWTLVEADSILDVSESISRQLLAHNEKYRRYCKED